MKKEKRERERERERERKREREVKTVFFTPVSQSGAFKPQKGIFFLQSEANCSSAS